MASDTESGSEYEVVKVLQQRRRRGLTEYLVRWGGFGPQEDSWEQEGKLRNCATLIQDFVKSSLTPAKTKAKRASRSRSSSRSRSRSRGRTSSKSRKSPSRKKVATPAKEKVVSVRQSRRSTAASSTVDATVVAETTTTTTKTVEEVKPLNNVDDEDVKRTVVKETWTTKTSQTKSTEDNKPAWQPQLPQALRLNTSDVPVMIIFSCITIITLCFLLESFVDFEAVWKSLAAWCAAGVAQVEGLLSGGEKVAPAKKA